ncbi:uncharacterized protein JCM6883_001735 [Sporobolomyces salmoneus]|uniref:uncharacterized protein n=1 Tax=Sporobolomyces salmoneus TaxID=183962 RepID=UPI00317C1A06
MTGDSILHTVEVPAFDPTTGQLSLEAHDLLPAPLSYSTSFSSRCTLLFDSAPPRPYDISSQEIEENARPKKKRKKGKSNEEMSAADWVVRRENQAKHRTTTDLESDEHHAKVVLHLEGAVDAVRQSWIDLTRGEDWTGIIRDQGTGSGINWIEKDQDGRKELDLAGATASREDSSIEAQIIQLDDCSSKSIKNLVGSLHVNNSKDKELILPLHENDSDKFSPFRLILPPSSGFLLSNFSESWSDPAGAISQIAQEVGGWDILIMDPPWPNASATRSGSYETFDPYDLWKLDVPELLGSAKKPVLVAIWLTNRVKYRRILFEKLFPAWNISNPVEWFWVKIASETGEPVWSFESAHRRCYEGLVLGWFIPPNAKTKPTPLPNRKVFLATPIGHSRKPVPLDLLIPFLPPSDSPPNVIELFARTTLAGPQGRTREKGRMESDGDDKRGFFLAVGNEAIKFNLSVDQKLDENAEYKGWIKLDLGENETKEEAQWNPEEQ